MKSHKQAQVPLRTSLWYWLLATPLFVLLPAVVGQRETLPTYLGGGLALVLAVLLWLLWRRHDAWWQRAMVARQQAEQALQHELQEQQQRHAALQRRNAWLQALADLSRTFSQAAPNYQAVVKSVVQSITEFVNDYCAICFFSADGAWLQNKIAFHPDPEIRAFLSKVWDTTPYAVADSPLDKQIYETGEAVFLPQVDQAQLSNIVDARIRLLLERLTFHSLMIVPMRVAGRIIGLLCVGRTQPNQPLFDQQDLELIQEIADRAALAIAPAELYQQLQEELLIRRQAEESLRLAKERLEKLAMASPSAMFSYRVAPDGTSSSLYASPVNYDLYGFTPEEVAHSGKLIYDRIHPEDKARMQTALETAARTQSVLHQTYRYWHPRKGEIWIEAFAAATTEPDGSVTWHGVANDVSEQKRAEQERYKNEERLQLALAAARMGVWEQDLHTNEVCWSPECYEILGAETFGGTLADPLHLVHPADRERLEKSAIAAVAQTEVFAAEFRTLSPTGETRWMANLGRAQYNEQGEPVRLIGVVQEVTARKLAETELEQSLEQVRSLALHLQEVREEERKRIAREIHDELGQSLAGLKFDLFWLENHLVTNDPAELQACREKTQEMANVIRSTIEVGRKIATGLRPRILDDLGLVTALQWLAQDFQARTQIYCTFQAVPEALALDAGRATALFRIFQESLTNVARHAQANTVWAELTVAEDHLVLTVQDNGRGITPAEINGTGSLGLLGIRERLLPFGGTMQIQGAHGQGTTVRVRLPFPSEEVFL